MPVGTVQDPGSGGDLVTGISVAEVAPWSIWAPGQIDALAERLVANPAYDEESRDKVLIEATALEASVGSLSGIMLFYIWAPEGFPRAVGWLRDYGQDPKRRRTVDDIMRELKYYKRSRGEKVFDYMVEPNGPFPLGPGVTQILGNSHKGSPLVTSHMRLWIVQPEGGVLCFSISIPDRERAEDLTGPFRDLVLSATATSE